MNTTLMNFAGALVALQAGELVSRQGWNGKGMYLFLVAGWDICHSPAMDRVHYKEPDIDAMEFLPFIAMRTADGKIVPWLASQTDILATDWDLAYS